MDHPLFDNSRLPADLEDRVQGELREGERLLWVGQPRPSRFAWQATPLVLFGIPWTAFAIFWMAGASGLLFGGPQPRALDMFSMIFPLFGIPFVLIGLGMLSAPIWAWRGALGTCYALTDQRAILWKSGWRGSVEVRSYQPAELTKLRRIEHRDGTGDLIFEELVTVGTDSDGHRTTSTRQHGFLAIDRVRDIEELLQKALLTPPPGVSEET